MTKPAIEQALQLYQDSVFKAAFYVCKNREDAEDVAQETFLAYCREHRDFESDEHVRAWLLRVAINKAKNLKASFWHRRRENVPDFTEWLSVRESDTQPLPDEEDLMLIQAVMELPEKCRMIVHLFYYEEYSVKEIAEILVINENTVKSQLHRGRTLLKSKLKEMWEDE